MNGKLLVIRVVSFSSILRLRVLVDAWFALLSHAQKQLIEPPSRGALLDWLNSYATLIWSKYGRNIVTRVVFGLGNACHNNWLGRCIAVLC